MVEQDEPGDTLIHTFHITDLVTCNHIWLRFHGKIGGEWIDSDSPIFHKHYSFIPPPGILREHFYLDGVPDIFAVKNPWGAGYSFIAQASYPLYHIVGWFTVREVPSLLDIAIYNATADWKPTGAPLATAQIDKTGLIAWPDYQPKEIPLAGPFIVEGQKYAVTYLTDCVDWDCGWMVWWRAGANPHRIISTDDQGTTWVTKDPGNSLAFENWGG